MTTRHHPLSHLDQDPQLHVLRVFGVVLAPAAGRLQFLDTSLAALTHMVLAGRLLKYGGWCTVSKVHKCTGVHEFWCIGVQVYRCTGVHVYRCTGVQVYR